MEVEMENGEWEAHKTKWKTSPDSRSMGKKKTKTFSHDYVNA